MRLLAIVAIISFLLIRLMPVSAQTVFNTGIWQLENYIADMTYSGTWTTITTSNVQSRTTTAASASVSFLATGKALLLHHINYPSTIGSRFQVCISAICTNVIAENGGTGTIFYGTPFSLPSGISTVTITRISGTVTLDYIMILDDASGSFPTAVPTATILPSSTPASTTTPQPTPTPQPTATAYTMPGAIWAVDPAKSYSSVNGQITSVEYTASAADVHLSNLLTTLLLSVWGMFLLHVFILSKAKK